MRRMLSVAVVAAIASLIVIPVAAGWAWPADGPVLRPFMLAADEYAAGQHRGIDIGAAAGEPVRAPATGIVSFVGAVPAGGRALTIQTADGYAVTLLQLGSVAVARGSTVAEGEVVGQRRRERGRRHHQAARSPRHPSQRRGERLRRPGRAAACPCAGARAGAGSSRAGSGAAGSRCRAGWARCADSGRRSRRCATGGHADAGGGDDYEGSERVVVPGHTTAELTAAHSRRRDSRTADCAAGVRRTNRADARRAPSRFRRGTASSHRVPRRSDRAAAAGRIESRDGRGRTAVVQGSGAPHGASATRGSNVLSLCIVDLRPVRRRSCRPGRGAQ